MSENSESNQKRERKRYITRIKGEPCKGAAQVVRISDRRATKAIAHRGDAIGVGEAATFVPRQEERERENPMGFLLQEGEKREGEMGVGAWVRDKRERGLGFSDRERKRESGEGLN